MLTQQLLVPALSFLAVLCLGGAVIIARRERRRLLIARLDTIEIGEGETVSASGNMRLLAPLARTGRMMSKKGPSRSLRGDLARAGYHHFMAAEIYLGIKMVLLILAATGLTLVAVSLPITLSWRILLVVAGASVLSFVPNIVIAMKRRQRGAAIRRALPDAIDLFEICVSAGMGMDMAWNAVADEVRHVSGPLADEMALTNLEIHLGEDRVEAMRHMADRTGAEELNALSAVLAQSEQFGTSIAEALRTFATDMREQRSLAAQESAERMAVKLVIPMVVFIFPTVMVVAAGPAGIKLHQLFGG